MKRMIAISALILTAVIFFAGIMMIFRSTDIGRDAGNIAIQKNGGSMDTQQYVMIIESTTENYRAGGMILSLFGAAGFLISGIGVYKEIDNSLN